jgi:hypothetical protein
MFSNFGAACAAFTLAGVAYFFGDTVSLSNFFFFAAAVALVVLSARFPLYKR